MLDLWIINSQIQTLAHDRSLLMAKSVLHLHRDPILTLLPWVMAMAAFIFGLSLVAFITGAQHSLTRDSLAQDEAVVVVPWQVDKLSQKERINRVVELIIETPGLSDVHIMTEDEQQALLEPWLGTALPHDDENPLQMAVPTLIKLRVQVAKTNPSETLPQLDKFRQQLTTIIEDAELVLNQQGRDQARRLALTYLSALALILALTFICMLMIIIFAVRLMLRSQASTIQTLRQLGATRRFIRTQFLSVSRRISLAGSFLAAIFMLLLAGVLWLSIPPDTIARMWFDQSLLAFPVSIICVGVLAFALAWLGTWWGLLQNLSKAD